VITYASISHYKSISEASLSFGPTNIIVGPNGSGKSNIIDALYFLHDCAVDNIDTAVTKRHGIDSLRQWSRTRPYNIVLEVRLKSSVGHGNYKVVISSAKGHYRIIEEHGSWTGVHPRERLRARSEKTIGQHSSFTRAENGAITFQTPFDDLRSDRPYRVEVDDLFLTPLAGRFFPHGAMSVFRPIAEELSSFSKYNIYPNTLRNPQLVSREAALAEDGGNLASVLKRINSNKRFLRTKEDIISALRIIMPSVEDFQVKSAAGYYVPVLRVREPNDDIHDFNLSQISDGTLRTLGLLAAFYQPAAPTKIGVEEPEQMIHPGALSVIYEAIKAFAGEASLDRQAFITTHSPTLLDLFRPENIIWARFKNGVTECGPVKRRQLDVIKQQLFTAGELLIAEGLF
jgi:predicted ATPase